MLQHIVLFKWKPGTTDAQVEEVFARAQDLVDGIDGVEQITLGRHRGGDGHGFTHAFIVNLSSEDALTEYLHHPVRQRYVTETLDAVEAERIEIDVPEDPAHVHRRGTGHAWEWGATRHSASADAAALRWEENQEDL